MSQQTMKQRARREAREVTAKVRRERAEREKRLEDLGVQVLTATGERDAAVAETERRAGVALREMTAEGLTLRDAVQWCGEQITVREATRLRRLADDVEPERRQPGDAEGGGVIAETG